MVRQWLHRRGRIYYQAMLAAERPDIVSVATQPEHRAAIVIWAAEHGVKLGSRLIGTPIDHPSPSPR